MNETQLVGCSPAIQQTLEDIEWASRSDAKVLLTGESGVGKEVVARLIHQKSRRSRRPMVAINCAGVPDTLLASELFGHARGSFTDAYRDKPGWLEQAHTGSVFLDEVGEMSLQMQALLLRFLENGEIQRVGGSEGRTTRVDVRVITATNRRLLERVAAKEFREDLYYRLNVVHIEIPPLRARREDVPVLLQHYIRLFSGTHRVRMPQVTEEAMRRLVEYEWPGNVRELRNLAERLVVRWRSGEVTPDDLPPELAARSFPPAKTVDRVATPSRAEALFDRMKQHRESFWSAVHAPFMARDLTRDDLRALVRGGLVATRGNYKALVKLFNMPPEDYKRFLSFLRKHHAHLPIHEFRAGSAHTRLTTGDHDSHSRDRAHETVAVG